MSRRAAIISQADIARVLRAYRNEGIKVRTRILPDGSTSFEPIAKEASDDESPNTDKEIVL
ncbi:hypothetical protein [Bradyrhizobium sp. DOA1]|uniref:hypothetical protein n=1 Tax=Bradyrhizobium sp. DOA1 TaxID=1126616 RepID=UPI00077C13A8|nr:hypothetical protein [Bradyrhizobium sp. DOA1]KYH01699.1 hypothetical protein SE91_27320 [Bradyrhizobium sp. DOA1]